MQWELISVGTRLTSNTNRIQLEIIRRWWWSEWASWSVIMKDLLQTTTPSHWCTSTTTNTRFNRAEVVVAMTTLWVQVWNAKTGKLNQCCCSLPENSAPLSNERGYISRRAFCQLLWFTFTNKTESENLRKLLKPFLSIWTSPQAS